jgi:hypothetical protein
MAAHIRVLRAEAAALTAEARRATDAAEEAVANDKTRMATLESSTAIILVRLSNAKLAAADQLEAEEPKLPLDDTPITYDPKGKPST